MTDGRHRLRTNEASCQLHAHDPDNIDAPDEELEPGIIPGGYQPPLKHVPPPSTTNGSGVVQPPDPPDDPPELDEPPDDDEDPDELEPPELELLDDVPPSGPGPGIQPPFTQ